MGLFFGSIFQDLLALIGLLAIGLYWYFTWYFDIWAKKGVPFLKPVPFFGNIFGFMTMQKSINEVQVEMYNKLKIYKFAGAFNSRTPALMLIDPDVIKQFLVKDFPHFQDRGIYIPPKQVLGQHLFSVESPRWRILRTKLTPTFTSGKMKMMFDLIHASGVHLQEYLAPHAAKGDIVELKEVLARFSTDVIGNCAFGVQMNAMTDENSQFRRMGRMFFEPSIRKQLIRVANFFFPDVAKHLNLDDIEDEVTEFFLKIVKETVDYRVKNNVTRNDFMQLMIDLKYKGKVDDSHNNKIPSANGVDKHSEEDFELDDGLFTAQVFVFFLAGFETSSTTMSFAMHELAVNPDVQTKLRNEIDATLRECGGKVTYDALMNMKYMDKVVSETLRMYPPVQALLREVTIPYTIPESGGITLEKGIKIVVPVYALQRDPKYFPEPQRFDPERFSDEEKAKRPHYVYLPFGEGPRNCIGMRFGLLQTKMGLFALLSKYEFHVCERTELPIRIDPKQLVTASTTGTILKITNRSDGVKC